jgi:hypothetical protein
VKPCLLQHVTFEYVWILRRFRIGVARTSAATFFWLEGTAIYQVFDVAQGSIL